MSTKSQVVFYVIALAVVSVLTYQSILVIDAFKARMAAPMAVQIGCIDGVEYYLMPDGNIAPRFTDTGLVLCDQSVVDPAAPVHPQSYTY